MSNIVHPLKKVSNWISNDEIMKKSKRCHQTADIRPMVRQHFKQFNILRCTLTSHGRNSKVQFVRKKHFWVWFPTCQIMMLWVSQFINIPKHQVMTGWAWESKIYFSCKLCLLTTHSVKCYFIADRCRWIDSYLFRKLKSKCLCPCKVMALQCWRQR